MTRPLQLTSYDRYRDSLQSIESLDAETERQLAHAWRNGDYDAGRRIVEASLPFVIRVAREYRRWRVPLEDLVQQGNLGLLKAASKYDPEKNCRLITYAVYWVRAEIRDYVVRMYRIVRLGSTRTERTAMRAYRRKGAENARELAALSGMPVGRAEMLWPLLAQGDVSLDARWDDWGPASDRLPDANVSPEEAATRREVVVGVRQALDGALDGLTDRERQIVKQRALSDDPKTLEQLGREMGVSKERIRQLEERAHEKLRASLAKFHPQAA